MNEPTLIGLSCPRCHAWLRATVLFAGTRADAQILSVECATLNCPVTTEDVRELLIR